MNTSSGDIKRSYNYAKKLLMNKVSKSPQQTMLLLRRCRILNIPFTVKLLAFKQTLKQDYVRWWSLLEQKHNRRPLELKQALEKEWEIPTGRAGASLWRCLCQSSQTHLVQLQMLYSTWNQAFWFAVCGLISLFQVYCFTLCDHTTDCKGGWTWCS